jgi:hypothetical protein|tara:strand:- start:17 stop:931 length:915 start_codon:yes stop_codon:yes gene_type:complete
MIVKIPKKIPKYFCEKCDYQTDNKKDFTKHLSTAKHKMIVNDSKKSPKIPKTQNNQFVCVCGKTYKYDSGYYRHKKVCNVEHITVFEDIQHDNAVITKSSHEHVDTMFELIKQNQEFKELIVEQNKQIMELAQKPTTINNNQKFNLNVFLNEQCKNAINLSEFLENMELDLEDLTETSRLGYVGGISRILINKLQELDIYKRPLHCTDMKRETLYIRENDEWSKENHSKQKMTELVNKVANKNCKNIRQWTDEHPEYQVFDSPENMEYVRLTQAVLGGLGDQECKQFKDKIIKSVIKEVMINKI